MSDSVKELTWAAWQAAGAEQRNAWRSEAAKLVGGQLSGDAIVVKGVKLVLVPGGQVELGWDGATTTLDAKRRAEWDANAEFGRPFETFLRYYLGPRRLVKTPAFLIEPSAVQVARLGVDPSSDEPEQELRSIITDSGFRLPTNDEWEIAMRAGTQTMFAWGDEWPDGMPYGKHTSFTAYLEPNALGIHPRPSPYQTEVVAEAEWLRGGDGGSAVCGGRPYPEPWYSYALAFQLPREVWEDIVSETFEEGFVRRARSL